MSASPISITRPFNLEDQTASGWLERARVCVDLIADLVSDDHRYVRVADLGCGDKKLQSFLAQRLPRLQYQGYDLLPQAPDVYPLDLNLQPPPANVDVTVMLGVSEYLTNLASILRAINNSSRLLVFSHVLRRLPPISPARLAELGWVNHFDFPSLQELVASCGMNIACHRLTPDRRTIVLACLSRSTAVTTR